jgi:hypothetical protein
MVPNVVNGLQLERIEPNSSRLTPRPYSVLRVFLGA